jgi:glyoxylase-like metal-dependent hydrolase (beta-lactamase superfamily II)
MSTQPNVKDFFDPKTNTFSYVVSDPATKQCAIIDSVLDYDSASAVTSTTHADKSSRMSKSRAYRLSGFWKRMYMHII